ncbi:MAG: ferrous iron transporter B [Burkholderiaceae bacterium]|nr:ferrous iron transporter B [Burkholderiaceae bacterium]
MTATAVVHVHPPGRLLALLGNPNCGKTALFNQLTGSRQKVANYAGVTVERKEGRLALPSGRTLRLLDLPGAYSLHPRSPDERVTRDVLMGQARGEKQPDALLCVVDASNLRRHLRLVLAARRLGRPLLVLLNMADVAEARGLRIDAAALSAALGVPVLRTVATRGEGLDALRQRLDSDALWATPGSSPNPERIADDPAGDHATVQALLARLGLDGIAPPGPSERIDAVVLHPVAGPLLLAVLLFGMFQAVFSWAEAPMGWIEDATAWLGGLISAALPEGWLRSLLVDGVIAGAGGVLVFLPQILILFLFILVLEESGYLPRAAALLDRLMGGVGLSGRSFIPLLSSFACAIPGIMASRTIGDARDRRVTMLIAPLMTCSARLPVYALLIGAFIPAREVTALGLQLQGLVLFALYLAGIAGAMAVAWVLKRWGGDGGALGVRTLMLELPSYHWPQPRSIAIGLWQRAAIFVKRVGGIILTLTIVLWALASWPGAPEGASGAAIQYSLAGMLGRGLELLLAPLGFNWQIAIALVPGLAAREVVVSALGTVYALSAEGDDAMAQALTPLLAGQWSLATGLALLAWFVFAPQCLATLAALKREGGGWRLPLQAAAYLFALAYAAAFVTYRVALALGWG